MARGARRDDAQSIDSLLDTMANVVGILVVLVAVTQLSLGDAIERIRERAGERAASTPADLAELVGQREVVLDAIELARSKIELFVGEPRAGMVLADATPLLDEFESLAGTRVAAGDAPSPDEVANLKIEVARLEGDVRTRQGEHEQLLAILAEPAEEDAPLTIRLPDPRPVPVGLERVFFLCRGGEVHPLDLPSLLDVLRDGVQAATGEYQATPVIGRRDVPWIVNHFKKERIVDQGYRWVFDAGLHAELVPTDDVAPGEGVDAMRSPGSRTAEALDRLSPRRNYVRFFVWPDSFDAYLAARRLAEERGLRVGWQEMEAGHNLRFDVLSSGRPGRNLLD